MRIHIYNTFKNDSETVNTNEADILTSYPPTRFVSIMLKLIGSPTVKPLLQASVFH